MTRQQARREGRPMSAPEIPLAAAGAAARALFHWDSRPYDFDAASSGEQEKYMAQAADALVAAAPWIIAQALRDAANVRDTRDDLMRFTLAQRAWMRRQASAMVAPGE